MRINPFKAIDELIQKDYRIPILEDARVDYDSKSESFVDIGSKDLSLRPILMAIKQAYIKLEYEKELLMKYHKQAAAYKDTAPRTEYREGCRDTFGTGFFLEFDEHKEIRELYWEIEGKLNDQP